jgi:hypothetical protein
MSEPHPQPENPGPDTNIKSGDPAASVPAPEPGLAYRSISGWAIAGFALGSLFTLLVVICALVAFYQGAPFFFRQWMFGLAILGVFVSLFAQRHVRNSEGTLAGAKLAQWGFRLSLVSGLVYFSYYFVTGYAVTSQANAFVMEEGEETGFFPRLRKGVDNPVEFDKAFLMTLPPSIRNGRPGDKPSMIKYHDTAKDGGGGLLTQFRESSILPRVLYKQLGTDKDTKITPGEVQDWKYENRSYMIERIYHVKTKEIEMDYLLAVHSAEAESAGQGRKWFINLRQSREILATAKLTKLGEGVARLRFFAGEFLKKRFEELNTGNHPLDTKLDQTPWEALAPGDFKQRQSHVHEAFAGKGPEWFQRFELASPTNSMPGNWEQVDGRIRFELLFRCALSKAPDREPMPRYLVEGVAAVDSKQVIDPENVTKDTDVDWSVAGIRFTAVSIPEDKSKLAKKKEP